jgi:hypothetical protein
MDSMLRSYAPSAVLMVQGTADAEAVCQKSSLGVVDLLRPFTRVSSSFRIATVGEPYDLHGCKLRFVHNTEFREVASETAEQHLTRLLR